MHRKRKTTSTKSLAPCAYKTPDQVRLLSLLLNFSLPLFGFPCSLDETIAVLEKTVLELRTELADSQHKIHRQKHQCEALYADGHVIDAAQLLLKIVRTTADDVKVDATIMDWISGEFCLRQPDERVQSLL